MGPVACLTLLLPLTQQAVGVFREILRKEKLTLITCIYNYIHLHCGFFLLLNDNFLLNKPFLKIQCFTKLRIFRELIL